MKIFTFHKAYLTSSNKDKLLLNFKNSFLYLGGTMVQFLISIFTLPIFSKYLAPEDFAIIGYYTAINAFFFPLFNLNLHSYYITNYYSAKNTDKNSDLSFGLNILNISNVFVGLIGIVIVTIYFKIFNVSFPVLPYLVIVFLFLFFDKYRMFYLIDCRIQKKGYSFLLISVLSIVFNVVFSLILVVQLKTGAAGKMAGPLISQILIAILIIYLWLKTKKFSFTIRFNINKIRDSFKFVWPLILSGYAYYPIGNIDKIFLERLNNPKEFGFYNVGLMVSSYVGVFFLALFQSFEPDLYKFIQQKKIKKYIFFSIGYSTLLILICGIFLLFSSIIFTILTGGRYTRASEYANVFIFGLLFQNIGGLIEPFFKVHKATKYLLINTSIIGIFSIVAYYLMIKYHGFKGANETRVLVAIFYLLSSFGLLYLFKHKKEKLTSKVL